MARFEQVLDDLEGLFGMFRAAWETGAKMGKNGAEDDSSDEEVAGRAEAAERGKAIMQDIMEGLEQATALASVLEEVGKAVRKVAKKGEDPEAFIEAGFEALEPTGDDDDDLRVGIQWLVIACSAGGGEPDEEEEEEKPKRKKPRWAKRGRE